MNKYTLSQILTAWEAAYGEDMSKEYPGFVQRLTEENSPSPDDGPAADAVKIDKPEEGKVYALTGGPGARCIANGYSWKDSVVGEDK